VLGRIAVWALGISILSRNAIGEVEPRFSDEKKARFVSEHSRSFCQIKTRGSQSPVLEFQTHVRTQSTLVEMKKVEMKKSGAEFGQRQKTCAVPCGHPVSI
jgi:hypothetical protein